MKRFCKIKDLLLYIEHRKSIDYGDKNKEKDVRLRIVLPENLTYPIIFNLHYSTLGAHASRSRVLQAIVAMFFKPKLYTQVKEILMRCRSCKFAIFQPKPSTLAAGRQMAPCFPRACFAWDLATDLPVTKNGNRHILIGVDHFSRFVILAGIPSRNAAAILHAFKTHWLPAFGAPLVIRSDNELSLGSTAFQNFCEKYGIVHSNSIAYGPQGNSIVEVVVKSIKNSLRSLAMMEDAKETWDEHLWVISSQFNAMPSRSLGHLSSERIMFQHSNINLRTHPLVLIQTRQAIPSLFKKKCEQLAFQCAHDEIRKNNDYTDSVPENEFMDPAFLKTIQHVCNVRDAIRTQNEKLFQHRKNKPSPIKVADLVVLRHMAVGNTGGASAAVAQKQHGPFIVTRVGDRRVEILHCVQGFKRITSLQFVNKYTCNDQDFFLPRNWSAELEAAFHSVNKDSQRSSSRPPVPNPKYQGGAEQQRSSKRTKKPSSKAL